MGKTENIIIIIVFNLFFVLFLTAIITFIRQYRIKKKEHLWLLQNQSEAHQRELLSTQMEIQLETMQHIGREIHDNIGQKLTLASLYTQQLVYENKAPQINENISNIGTIINDSLSELRQLSKSLTDDTIETATISELIEQECRKISALGKCRIAFASDARNLVIPYQQKSVLFRITQEFLQNSIKHADCEKISVRLQSSGNQLQLSLCDDGKGFDIAQTSKGIGISNMKKRAAIIGARLQLESNANGTVLTIDINL